MTLKVIDSIGPQVAEKITLDKIPVGTVFLGVLEGDSGSTAAYLRVDTGAIRLNGSGEYSYWPTMVLVKVNPKLKRSAEIPHGRKVQDYKAVQAELILRRFIL